MEIRRINNGEIFYFGNDVIPKYNFNAKELDEETRKSSPRAGLEGSTYLQAHTINKNLTIMKIKYLILFLLFVNFFVKAQNIKYYRTMPRNDYGVVFINNGKKCLNQKKY